ncbi:MAG: alpha/beta fold hydrolase [Elsteraceae bacterium]
MFVSVNGTKLFVDVEGAGWVPDGSTLRQKPTLLLLHGGPGFDHSMFKPMFAELSDVAQIVYFDHRGNGRSACDDRKSWTLAQWGDDVKGLCDALGIVKPIVYGLSFGGFVAQSYATRHPDHPAGLILASTSPRMDLPPILEAFEKIGGKEARRIAADYWTNPTPESRAVYLEKCHPLYNTKFKPDQERNQRAVINTAMSVHFAGSGGEFSRMDFRADLAKIRCPTLVTCGTKDPITPVAFSKTIAACLDPDLVTLEIYRDCGHGVHLDAPKKAFRALRKFIRKASKR